MFSSAAFAMILSKLSLGTAQFGAVYGVTNDIGRVSNEEIVQIVRYAQSNGISSIDTAVAYGDAEERLGLLDLSGFSVITKVPAYDGSVPARTWLMGHVNASISRMRVRPSSVLLHHPADLLGPYGPELSRALHDALDSGFIGGIGVSVYEPGELAALNRVVKCTDIQLPFSVIDRRMLSCDFLEHLVNEGVRIHARSAFLQGLLLQRPESLPVFFSRWRPLWVRWWGWLEENDIDPVAACLSFSLNTPLIFRVVVGVLSVEQLKYISEVLSYAPIEVPDWMAVGELDLIDPSRWRLVS
ncbi:MAG: aldo/keto reductase [Gammaproteobacteria bacterium]|nr:aldo/keto reductase [Gammaproteobacteria bacterium]